MTSAAKPRGDWLEGALAGNIGYLVAQANVTATRQFSVHIGEPLALRPVEYSLLMLLRANESLTPSQLARALVLPAPSLTMVIDRLQQRGLVERVRSETDRRSQRVLLTAGGEAMARDAEQRSPAMHAEMDAALTPGERMLLTELLRKVAELGRR